MGTNKRATESQPFQFNYVKHLKSIFMKTLISVIKSKSIAEVRDAFIVLTIIGSLILLAQIGYWIGLITVYPWQ